MRRNEPTYCNIIPAAMAAAAAQNICLRMYFNVFVRIFLCGPIFAGAKR